MHKRFLKIHITSGSIRIPLSNDEQAERWAEKLDKAIEGKSGVLEFSFLFTGEQLPRGRAVIKPAAINAYEILPEDNTFSETQMEFMRQCASALRRDNESETWKESS